MKISFSPGIPKKCLILVLSLDFWLQKSSALRAYRSSLGLAARCTLAVKCILVQAPHALSCLIAQMKTALRFFFLRAAVMYHFSFFLALS